MASPSPDPVSRSRLTRPVSTTSEPCPNSRWSIDRPMTAPAKRPIATDEMPSTEPPTAPPMAAPAADRRIVAMLIPPQERRSAPRSAAARARSARFPPRHAPNRHGQSARPAPRACRCPDAWPQPPCASERGSRRRAPHRAPDAPAGGAAQRPTAPLRARARTSPPNRRAAARARRPLPRARPRAPSPGNRSPPPGTPPDGGRACRASRAPRPRSHLAGRSSAAAPAIEARRLGGIGDHPVIAGNVREPLEVQKVVELELTGLPPLVAARLDPQRVAGQNLRSQRVPQLDHPRSSIHTVAFDHPLQALCRAALHLQHPVPEPVLGKPGRIGEAEHAVLHNLLDRAGRHIPRRIEVEGAIAIPQHGAAGFLVNPSQRHVECIGETPQFRLERAARAPNIADRPGKDRHPLGHVLPVDDPRPYRRAVIAPGLDIRLADRRVRQRAQRLRIVDGKPGAGRHGARAHPRLGAKLDALEMQRAVVIGETHHRPVAPHERPGPAGGAHPAPEMRGQRLRPGHTRISTTGTLGTSPAWKLARLTWIRSVSNRTGTSNSYPAVTATSRLGGSAKVTMPVVSSTS